jgi:hypothetical protein
MRLLRFRFTVRWLMVIVATATIAAAVAIESPMAKRIMAHLKDASRHARAERESYDQARRLEVSGHEFDAADRAFELGSGDREWSDSMAERRRLLIESHRQTAAYHAAWKWLHLRAAWHPWEPLAKGPPPAMPPPPPDLVPPPPVDQLRFSPPDSEQSGGEGNPTEPPSDDKVKKPEPRALAPKE